MSNFSQLFTDIKISTLKLKNRLVVAPMTRVSATPNGIPTEIMRAHYEDYAKGGWGLINNSALETDKIFTVEEVKSSGFKMRGNFESEFQGSTESMHGFYKGRGFSPSGS